jgi:hypothetical protein
MALALLKNNLRCRRKHPFGDFAFETLSELVGGKSSFVRVDQILQLATARGSHSIGDCRGIRFSIVQLNRLPLHSHHESFHRGFFLRIGSASASA